MEEDALAPAKGVINALILVIPFWAAIALWIWWTPFLGMIARAIGS